MKLSTNRVVGIIAVILAIVAALGLGQLRKEHFMAKAATDLLEVEYRHWICDEAKLLNDATEKTVEEYNKAWDEKYYAVVAVASVKRMVGWEETDYAAALGQKWGLGENDMILVLVEDGDWQVYMGDYIGAVMQDYHQQDFRLALDEPYYDGDFNGAVTAFYRQADVFYAEIAATNPQVDYDYYGWEAPAKRSWEFNSVLGVFLLIMGIFIVWAIVDGMRYRRYRRRYIVTNYVSPPPYYPVFWGRRHYHHHYYHRPAPPPPPRHHGGGYRPRPSQPRPSQSRPAQSRPSQSRPAQTSRPTGGFSGGGFRGGQRSTGGGGLRRSGSSGGSRSGGFGGSRGGGSRGGGLRGGRR